MRKQKQTEKHMDTSSKRIKSWNLMFQNKTQNWNRKSRSYKTQCYCVAQTNSRWEKSFCDKTNWGCLKQTRCTLFAMATATMRSALSSTILACREKDESKERLYSPCRTALSAPFLLSFCNFCFLFGVFFVLFIFCCIWVWVSSTLFFSLLSSFFVIFFMLLDFFAYKMLFCCNTYQYWVLS